MILVLSIPHTGTHFVRDHLLADYECEALHIWPDQREIWFERMLTVDKVIVPIRHPIEVAKSWKRRGKNPQELPTWWRLLTGVVDPAKPRYLALDQPGVRNWQLADINLNFDLDLKTDWPVVREVDGHHVEDVELTPKEMATCGLVMYAAKPFLDRWY